MPLQSKDLLMAPVNFTVKQVQRSSALHSLERWGHHLSFKQFSRQARLLLLLYLADAYMQGPSSVG